MIARDTLVPPGVTISYEMSPRDYHGDADGPRLSQSLATLACCKSAMHAWAAHPLLGAGPGWKYVPGTDDGTIIHSLVLEPDGNQIEEIDPSTILTKTGAVAASPFATTEGKRVRDRSLANGRIPLLPEPLGAYRYKAQALRSRFEDIGLLFDGESEVVIYWDEPGPFGPVRCRARLDELIVGPDRIRIIDLKTCESAHPDDAQGVIWRKGYDIQRASYVRAVEAAFPDYIGRVDFEIAFAELDKPYAVSLVTLDEELARAGELRWERGLGRWAEGLREDNWPAYGRRSVGMPAWAKTKEMGE